MGIAGFYGLHMFLVLLALLSVLLFTVWNVRWIKGLNNWWWWTLDIAIILGFLLATIFAILAILFSDICGFINS